jgi:hypothetical protein
MAPNGWPRRSAPRCPRCGLSGRVSSGSAPGRVPESQVCCSLCALSASSSSRPNLRGGVRTLQACWAQFSSSSPSRYCSRAPWGFCTQGDAECCLPARWWQASSSSVLVFLELGSLPQTQSPALRPPGHKSLRRGLLRRLSQRLRLLLRPDSRRQLHLRHHLRRRPRPRRHPLGQPHPHRRPRQRWPPHHRRSPTPAAPHRTLGDTTSAVAAA